MKYVVTGGCGFIGSHIAEALLARGDEVTLFDNLSSGREENIAGFRERVEFIRGDVRDAAAVRAACENAAGVFHEAALVSVFDSVARPEDCHEINITGTLNVLSAARAAGVRRVLLAASAAAYGNEPTLPKQETMRPRPESPYAVTKVAGEYYLEVFAKLYGLETVALRYFNVFGPRQDPSSPYSGVISKFTDILSAGKRPTVFGDGKQSRDFVFVKDVARANLAAMNSEQVGRGEVINIARGRRTDLLELLKTLGKIYGTSVEPEFKPARTGDIRHSQAEVSLARELLGFEAQYSLEEGLRELVACLKEKKEKAE